MLMPLAINGSTTGTPLSDDTEKDGAGAFDFPPIAEGGDPLRQGMVNFIRVRRTVQKRMRAIGLLS